jgi:hypothetical protein
MLLQDVLQLLYVAVSRRHCDGNMCSHEKTIELGLCARRPMPTHRFKLCIHMSETRSTTACPRDKNPQRELVVCDVNGSQTQVLHKSTTQCHIDASGSSDFQVSCRTSTESPPSPNILMA